EKAAILRHAWGSVAVRKETPKRGNRAGRKPTCGEKPLESGRGEARRLPAPHHPQVGRESGLRGPRPAGGKCFRYSITAANLRASGQKPDRACPEGRRTAVERRDHRAGKNAEPSPRLRDARTPGGHPGLQWHPVSWLARRPPRGKRFNRND